MVALVVVRHGDGARCVNVEVRVGGMCQNWQSCNGSCAIGQEAEVREGKEVEEGRVAVKGLFQESDILRRRVEFAKGQDVLLFSKLCPELAE